MNTKENILKESLNLFSKNGYEAVSVSDIAGALGMTKSALYKHYKNKQDILDSIIERMKENDESRAKEYDVPEGTILEMPEKYKEKPLSNMIIFLERQFIYWTEDEFASAFRRMLTIEQYRNETMSKLYQDYLSGGVITYITDFFKERMKQGDLKSGNAEKMAVEFYSFAYMLMNLYDVSSDKEKVLNLLREHLDQFRRTYEI